MASSSSVYAGIGEGQSTSRPPLFDGTNYSYWKERMMIYVQSINYPLWLIIEDGDKLPTKKVGDKDVPKEKSELTDEDFKKLELNAKAKNMLFCAVNPDDYRKISCCSSAKEMWDKLKITYEGTNQVRKAKIDFLNCEYELFKMKEKERIEDMFERFSKIINDLNALGKKFDEEDLIRKILRSLTKEWRPKADAISETLETSNTTFDGLRGNLITYESTILNPLLNDDRRNKGIALKAKSSRKQMEESSSDDDSCDEEFDIMMKKFQTFVKKKMDGKGKKEKTPKCYECGEPGHIKPNCPKLKNEKKKKLVKRAHRACISWGGDSGDETSSDEEEEHANLCLMANEESEEEGNSFDSQNNLQESYDELFDEFFKVSKLNKSLKKDVACLGKDIEALKLENDRLKEENKVLGKRDIDSIDCKSCESLRIQVSNLEGTLKKFSTSHKDLNSVIDSMQVTKHGLGFDKGKVETKSKSSKVPTRKHDKPPRNHSWQYRKFPRNHNKRTNNNVDIELEVSRPHKSYRVHKPMRMYNPNVTCHYCNKIGHIRPVCFTRHRHLNASYYCHANSQGPKMDWVPKLY